MTTSTIGGSGGGGGGIPDVDLVNDDYTQSLSTVGTFFGNTINIATPSGIQLSQDQPNLGGGVVFTGSLPETVTVEFDWSFTNPGGGGSEGDGNSISFFTSDLTSYTSGLKWYQNGPTGMNFTAVTYDGQIIFYGNEIATSNNNPVLPQFVSEQTYTMKIDITPTTIQYFIDGVLFLNYPLASPLYS